MSDLAWAILATVIISGLVGLWMWLDFRNNPGRYFEMTDQLKTVDEIMEIARLYRNDPDWRRYSDALRAAITDLHTAATRKQETGIMSEEDRIHESCVSP